MSVAFETRVVVSEGVMSRRSHGTMIEERENMMDVRDFIQDATSSTDRASTACTAAFIKISRLYGIVTLFPTPRVGLVASVIVNGGFSGGISTGLREHGCSGAFTGR